MSQFTAGKCFLWANFLSRPQKTCDGRKTQESWPICTYQTKCLKMNTNFTTSGHHSRWWKDVQCNQENNSFTHCKPTQEDKSSIIQPGQYQELQQWQGQRSLHQGGRQLRQWLHSQFYLGFPSTSPFLHAHRRKLILQQDKLDNHCLQASQPAQ